MYQVIVRAKTWVDITSLSPPDGKFLIQFRKAVSKLAENACDMYQDSDKKITIRMLFGNIIGMPVDCHALISQLTADVIDASHIELWVGSWRKGLSWNHSKIIAVDGKHLFTGGHNLWDPHYLQTDPIHDMSMEARGVVAKDGHRFALQSIRAAQRSGHVVNENDRASALRDLQKHYGIGQDALTDYYD